MDDKMKAKCYRLDYNELGLSTLCVEKDSEIKRLKEEYVMLQNASDEVEEEKDKEIERLNNDIKELLKENSNKEKVIKIQDNIINKANEYIKVCKSNDMGIRYQRIEEILQGSDKE